MVEALIAFYAPHAIGLDHRAHAAFAGNAIALGPQVWMSAGAKDALGANQRGVLAEAGFAFAGVELNAVEAAGGSLRCCVGEVF